MFYRKRTDLRYTNGNKAKERGGKRIMAKKNVEDIIPFTIKDKNGAKFVADSTPTIIPEGKFLCSVEVNDDEYYLLYSPEDGMVLREVN